MSSPRERRTLTTMLNLFSRKSLKSSVFCASALRKSASSMGLYSMRFTLHGTQAAKRARSRASSMSSLNPPSRMYSKVTRVPVFSWKYTSASLRLARSLVSLISMIRLRLPSSAAWRLRAKLNLTSSSPSFRIILAMPAVETVMRFGLMPRPGVPVMRSTDSRTLR